MTSYLMWGGFLLFILAMLVLDLKVFQRQSHKITVRESLLWTLFWIILALTFNAGIWHFQGSQKALEFLTGYLIEKSLSVDNIFVFLLIFSYFKVKPEYQHRVLFFGILGALIMRAIFILAGITLIENLHWVIYLFGAFLIFIGIRMAFEKEKEVHPEENPLLKLFQRFFPVSKTMHGEKFWIRDKGRLTATPLLIVVIVVESTDLVFAVDSIPAIFSITLDPFIVYTSNVFAILGLRALYFAVAGIMDMFHYLHYGLSLILVFVGIKMLTAEFFPIPTWAALAVVGGLLLLSALLSILFPAKTAPQK